MKIATWNLDTGTTDLKRRADAFRIAMDEIEADVWVLTEPLLGFSPGADYRLVANSCPAADLRLIGKEWSADRRWVAIWSRLKATEVKILCDPERMACTRVEERDHPIIVVGTVLPWARDNRHSLKNDAPETNAESSEFCQMLHAQSMEWRRLWPDPDKAGFCIAGDFNQESLFFPHPEGNKRHACINLTKILAPARPTDSYPTAVAEGRAH